MSEITKELEALNADGADRLVELVHKLPLNYRLVIYGQVMAFKTMEDIGTSAVPQPEAELLK